MQKCLNVGGVINQGEGEDRSTQMNDFNGASVEKLDKFCYLRDTIEEDGGLLQAVVARITNGWNSFR